MMVQITPITVQDRNGLRILKFDNIKRKNAVSISTYKSIIKSLKEAEIDDTVRIVAFTGAEDFYSSGNDMGAMSSRLAGGQNLEDALLESKLILTEMVRAIFTFPKPLIAVVNGPAIGIAATTAALCDVVYASETVIYTS